MRSAGTLRRRAVPCGNGIQEAAMSVESDPTVRVRIPADPAKGLFQRGCGRPAPVRAGTDRNRAASCGPVLVRPGHAAGQHRELHRRRAGADRHRRAAAHQRRARAGRLLRPDGHDRGHAGRQLQPGHAPADRVRRREDHGRRRPMQRAPVFMLRRRARGPATSASGSTSTPTRSRAAAESTTRVGHLLESASTRSDRCATCASTTRPATRPGRT